MNIETIHESYRPEMVKSFETLAAMTLDGKLTTKQFLEAQRRVYDAYRVASLRRAVAWM